LLSQLSFSQANPNPGKERRSFILSLDEYPRAARIPVSSHAGAVARSFATAEASREHDARSQC